MKIINVNDTAVFSEVAAVLAAGGLVVHPTETCYGFAVDVFNEKALGKLYRVKGMELDKPLSILVSSLEMARDYAEFSELAEGFAGKYWPGPLSLLLPRSCKLPEFFNFGHDFLSLRVSGMEFCRRIVEEFSFPVSTTSVNMAGEPPLYSLESGVLCGFLKDVDLIVDGGVLFENMPSTLLKISGYKLELLREGDCVIDLVLE